MSNIVARIADAVSPALVAFPIVIMLTTAAHAQSAQPTVAQLQVQPSHAMASPTAIATAAFAAR